MNIYDDNITALPLQNMQTVEVLTKTQNSYIDVQDA